MRTIECHEEKIHLCGNIQDLGYLIVFDDYSCIAASENISEITSFTAATIVGNFLEDILNDIVPKLELTHAVIEKEISGNLFYRYVERILLNEQHYYISIYRHNNKLYVEIELAHREQIKSTSLYYYAKFIEDRELESTWQSLTHLIREIIGFDRVLVYQFLEDKGGKVVAESKNDNIESLMGFRYPEFDIPKQARELYKIFHARHTADVDAPVFKILGRSAEEIDLTRCSIRALSPTHLQYIRNSGMRASASFSIIVEGELWGMVTCQHHTPIHVDLSQRHLCVFLTQYAVNYYLAEFQKEKLISQTVMGILERDLKAELLITRDKYGVLERFGGQIMEIISANGLVIKHDYGKYTFGQIPDDEKLQEIEKFISERLYETIYFTDAYDQVSRVSIDDKNPFLPGILRLDLMPATGWYLYAFRKERIVQETWAGKPEKVIRYDPHNNVNYASPRNSFQAWIEITKGKAEAWKHSDIQFLKDVANIVQHSIAQRGGEIEELNKELIRSNNALETFGYTLTHDLKNPLTSIQLSAQMFIRKKDMPDALRLKLAENIIESSKLINDMMDKVYKMSQVTNIEFELELIDPTPKIEAIAENSKYQYEVTNLLFDLGPCLPIWGERTLIYQLFLNIVGNAIKYSSKNQSPKVEVYSKNEGEGKIIYYIKDNGIGMDLSDQSNIFEIFKRMPNTQGFEGSGIGLSIVKRIADKLGAKIFVESELNIGTVFMIEFSESISLQL
ncbi:ATP-binding protein [Chryseobacterium sp. KACC 21268]|nr:ATP-binding protein [Chryseobacterium sp. KACC 21268]